MMKNTTTSSPIRIPTTASTCWMAAHEHFVSYYTQWDDFVFITLHSGHQLYGYTSEAGWINYMSHEAYGDYEEYFDPAFWAEDLANSDDWVEAIRDIPALYAYHEAYSSTLD